MKKISAIFTGFDASLYSIVESALRRNLPQGGYTLLTFANPDLIAQTLAAGRVTERVAYELTASFLTAASQGADVILSVCSTMGDVAEAVKPALAAMGIPLVRIDEAMMRHAVQTYTRIAFIATCDTIMGPNRNLMEKCLREEHSNAAVTYFVINEMQGKPGPMAASAAVETMMPYRDQFDAVVMTQASMAPLTEGMSQRLGIPVLSSSDFGARAVAEILNSGKEPL